MVNPLYPFGIKYFEIKTILHLAQKSIQFTLSLLK